MCDTIHVTSSMCDTIHVTPPMCHHPCATQVQHFPRNSNCDQIYCNVEGVTWWVCSTTKRFTLLQRGRRHMVGVQYNKKVHSTATWKASRGGCAVQITGSPQFRNSQVVRWRVCVCNNCFLLPGRSCYLEGVTWWMYGATKRFTAM